MKIDFFEEFPTLNNIMKAELIDFESKIFIGAKSYTEYTIISRRLRRLNNLIRTSYWHILKKSYWLSPFSYTDEIIKILLMLNKREIRENNIEILLDLELPILNKKLFVKNIIHFFKNKNLIANALLLGHKNGLKIITAEYPPIGKLSSKLFRSMGLSFPTSLYHHAKMILYYSSMMNKKVQKLIRKFIINISEEENVMVGLGVIERGILGNEKILSPKDLEKDLQFFDKLGIKEIAIFRLGGLNKNYIQVIRKYL